MCISPKSSNDFKKTHSTTSFSSTLQKHVHTLNYSPKQNFCNVTKTVNPKGWCPSACKIWPHITELLVVLDDASLHLSWMMTPRASLGLQRPQECSQGDWSHHEGELTQPIYCSFFPWHLEKAVTSGSIHFPRGSLAHRHSAFPEQCCYPQYPPNVLFAPQCLPPKTRTQRLQ